MIGRFYTFHKLNEIIQDFYIGNFSDVIWALRHLKLPESELVVEKRAEANNKDIIKISQCPFEIGIHHWLVDSPCKGPVMQKSFPCCDVTTHSNNDDYTNPITTDNTTKTKQSKTKHLCTIQDKDDYHIQNVK